MHYAITGNKGLIGTFLKKELDKKNTCVLEIDKKEGFDVNDLENSGEKIDMMFHFAAQCKIKESIKHPELPHKNNTDGIFKVLEFCRKNGINKIIVASSSRVLSKERNPYVASKIYLEELTKAYHECYGIEYIIVRPSTVYGPMSDVTSRLMHTWCENAIKDKELPIYGDKNKTLDFTYITDFVDAIKILVNKWEESKNETYNISGNQETNLVDLATIIIEKAKGGRLEFYPKEIAQPQQVSVNTTKIRNLGYKPKISLIEGINKMLEHYK